VEPSDLTASLLVAMPQLQDPNFQRSVALLVHHDSEGTFGLVLNRPAELSATELCASLDVRWGGSEGETIHWGGPVQPNTGWVLYCGDAALGDCADEVTELAGQVRFAGSLDVLRSIASAPPPEVRLFLGYAGWGPGQLELEMAEGAWLVAPCSRDAIFHVPPEEMWTHVVRHLGIDPATLVPTRGVH
jgi:putative transcriptional regulator